MKVSCKVIEDMLPMYYDNVCSTETAALVEDHLADCQHCKQILADLRGEIELPLEKPDDIKPLKRIQKSYKKKRTIAIIALFVVIAMIPLAFSFGSKHGKETQQIETYSEENAIADADIFMHCIVDGNYTSAFSMFDIAEKKREWQRDFFTSEILVNFENDALEAFCNAGANIETLGGIRSYELKSVTESGYDNYGNKAYYISYDIAFNGKTEGLSLHISKRGIGYFLAGDSSITHPLTAFCYWGQTLYEEYLKKT